MCNVVSMSLIIAHIIRTVNSFLRFYQTFFDIKIQNCQDDSGCETELYQNIVTAGELKHNSTIIQQFV